MYFTLDIGKPLRLSGCWNRAICRFRDDSRPIALASSHYHTERHLLSGGNCFDGDGAGGAGGVAGPPVDLTMMSRVEKPSKNSNAANHHMVGFSNTALLSYLVVFTSHDLRICGLLYDRMMKVMRELPAPGNGSMEWSWPTSARTFARRNRWFLSIMTIYSAQPKERQMRTHRFGRKIKLPATIAIKHQIRMRMAQYEVEKAEAEAKAEVFRGQTDDNPSMSSSSVTTP
jgi:hypothetical protein